MIELKVQCDCGQKYKFDVEPVNGRMPFTVNCPICGLDGTGNANALLEQMPAYQAAQTPPPVAPALQQPRLRINSPAHTPAAAPPPISSVPTPPPPIGPMQSRFSVAARKPEAATGKSGRKPSFAMGLVGGLVGAVTGAAIYFLVFRYTGFRFKLLAVGVGGLAGWWAELFGKGEGSKELGGITAVFVLAGIVGAQYFVALSWWHEFSPGRIADLAYTARLTQAREVVKAVPTGSDEEIRNYLAADAAADVEEKPNPDSISIEAIKKFRETSLPEFRELASGKITKEQFNTKNGLDAPQEQKEQDMEENTFKAVFMLLLINKANIFSLCAAAGLAFKLSSNA